MALSTFNPESHPLPTVLEAEALESRDNPNGAVSAFVSGNTLFVIGDGDPGGNQVRVRQDVYGNTFVAGLAGTTVNGQAEVYVGTGTPARVSIQLNGGGPDYAEVVNVTAGSVDVSTGEGNDGTVMNGVLADTVFVNLGGGNDGVDLRNVATHYGTYVSAGDGFDTLYLGPVYGPAYYQQFEQAFPAG